MRHGYMAFSVILHEKLPKRPKLERTPWDWEYLKNNDKIFFVQTTHSNKIPGAIPLYVDTVLHELFQTVLGYSRYRIFIFGFLRWNLCSHYALPLKYQRTTEKKDYSKLYLTVGWGKSQGEDWDKWVISDLTSQTFKDTIKYRCSTLLSLLWHNLYTK